MFDILVSILVMLTLVSIFGYLLSTIKEKRDLMENKIEIKSKKVTQHLLDELDMKIFQLGKIHLNIGDELKIVLKNNKLLKGTLLGAKKSTNEICLVTKDDEIVELSVKTIDNLRIISKYGKLF